MSNQVTIYEQYRPLLFAIAYRMLGSVMEAEDVVQDTFLRYEAADKTEIRSDKAFLTTIVSRLCLNQLQSARVKRETYVGSWLPEPILGDAYADLANPARLFQAHESISLAFLLLLENLTPLERAVFLLREVFDYAYPEISHFVGRSEPACRQLFSRAKRYLAQNRPRFESSSEAHQSLVESFTEAIGNGDLSGLMAVLADDVVFWGDGGGRVRGASTKPISGQMPVAQFLVNVVKFAPTEFIFELAEVNGRSGIVIRDADKRPFTVISLGVQNGLIDQIHAIANPDKLHAIPQ